LSRFSTPIPETCLDREDGPRFLEFQCATISRDFAGRYICIHPLKRNKLLVDRKLLAATSCISHIIRTLHLHLQLNQEIIGFIPGLPEVVSQPSRLMELSFAFPHRPRRQNNGNWVVIVLLTSPATNAFDLAGQ